MPFFEVEEGIKLFYDVIGNGPQKVLMIMGLTTSHRAWLPNVMEILNHSTEYQFCVFDNRGAGQSTVPYGRYTTTMMANDAVKLCEHLGEDFLKPHVVGISMGGMIAQEFTLKWIELGRKLSSLSLCVTHAGRSSALMPPVRGVISMMRSLICRTPEQRAEVLLDTLYSPEFLETEHDDGRKKKDYVTQLYLDRVKADPPSTLSGFVGHISAVFTHDVPTARLEIIKNSGIPILIITGDNDHLVSHQNSLFLKEALNPAEFLLLEGVGHGIHTEKFVQFNEALMRNFQRGVEIKNNL